MQLIIVWRSIHSGKNWFLERARGRHSSFTSGDLNEGQIRDVTVAFASSALTLQTNPNGNWGAMEISTRREETLYVWKQSKGLWYMKPTFINKKNKIDLKNYQKIEFDIPKVVINYYKHSHVPRLAMGINKFWDRCLELLVWACMISATKFFDVSYIFLLYRHSLYSHASRWYVRERH